MSSPAATITSVKQAARRFGKTLAMVLPVVMVTTGTLAVTRVPLAPPSNSDPHLLTAATRTQDLSADSAPARQAAPQERLRHRLLYELRSKDPAAALILLQRTMQTQPSLTRYCTGIARDLGRAAVQKYGGDTRQAQSFSRPVCDGSFAAGVAAAN